MQKDIFIYKMSAVVKRALPLLETLVNANRKLKKAIIQYASPDLVTAISEIALNMLKGIIKLTPQQKQRLSRYKKEFRSLAKKDLIRKEEKENSGSERYWSRPCCVTTYSTFTACGEMKRMVLIPEERLLRYEECDKQKSGNDLPEGIMHGGGEDLEETLEDSLSAEMIVRGIPKTMKTRAQALLERLKEREDVVTWDDMGQVLLNGVLIPKSNISDLISDAMRSRKHFNPVGVREFYKVLNEINFPKDLVRNERRWSETEKNSLGEKIGILHARKRSVINPASFF